MISAMSMVAKAMETTRIIQEKRVHNERTQEHHAAFRLVGSLRGSSQKGRQDAFRMDGRTVQRGLAESCAEATERTSASTQAEA